MTSFKSSFQSCLPLGGFVNQRVQVCCSWCLTLKLEGSSKTVTTLPLEAAPLVALSSLLSPSGEMGMVSSGTGSVGLEATSAMFAMCGSVGLCVVVLVRM